MTGAANSDVQYEFAQYGRNTTTYAIANTRSKCELLAPFAPLLMSNVRTASRCPLWSERKGPDNSAAARLPTLDAVEKIAHCAVERCRLLDV